ncbi:MAG: cyanobactin biosynthesis system PatB/AcyB/McaB family protein [Dehalococcoidia bacterium]
MTAHPPPQLAPVRRPHFIQPHTCVEVDGGPLEQLLWIRMKLLHGANYNDPAYYMQHHNDVLRRR